MKGKKQFTKTEAEQIKVLINQKLKASATEQKNIRNKIRKLGFYASDFGLGGGYSVNDFTRYISVIGEGEISKAILVKKNIPTQIKATIGNKRSESDEAYIINICDKILKEDALRQHKFDFLLGDSGVKLPVDAYYPKHNLVIEYLEKQHTESVKFFDRRATVSGVGRGEQRKIYDERRRVLIPKNGIQFITFCYSEFEHSSSKRLLRIISNDENIIKLKLNKILK